MNYTTASTDKVARKLFAPLFRARWQNMQNIITDSVYLDRIPAAYKTYYIAYINQWLSWSRGFVIQLHKQDFFSTGVGYSVCELLTKMSMAGGYRIKATDKQAQTFMEEWQKDDLTNILASMFFNQNAGGNALLVLTPNGEEIYPSVIPINRAVFQIGRTGDVTQCTILNRFISGGCAYYTEEDRIYIDGKPMWRVRLAEATPVTSPSWGQNWIKQVPIEIEEQWRETYGELIPGEIYQMPERMRGLGVYNVKNKQSAVALVDMPGYSDSTLHTCLDILYSIDYNYTQAQVDQYMGRSRCLVPRQMQSRTVMGMPGTVTDGLTFTEAVDGFKSQELEEMFYTQIGDNTVDGKPIAPTFLQPDLRGQMRKYIRDSDLELLAGKIGISASSLISTMSGGGTKTDDQINSEAGLDEKTISMKRQLADRAINAMLSDVAYFYGFDDNISIQWGKTGANSARENDELMQDYREGVLPLRDYLKKRWSDMTEDEIERMAKDIEKEQERRAAFAPDGGGGYGESFI